MQLAKGAIDQVEYINYIRLIRSENLGARTFNHLIALYGSASKALDNVEELAGNGGLRRKIKIAGEDGVRLELEKVERYGARMLCAFEPGYPDLLKNLVDAPPVITVLGELPECRMVAIVGARNASLNGCNFAKEVSGGLVENKIAVVSGLARGIDTYAHIGALACDAIKHRTVAVIAGGIDHIYPHENEKLYRRIAENGAVVAELPFGCAPLAKHFPQRNRIIAGMSVATAVIEAARKSGSLITADLANSYERKVFAMPGSPMDARAGGTNHLLRNGASMLESVDDILTFLHRKETRLHDSQGLGGFELSPQLPDEKDLAKHRKTLQEALSYSPTSLDAVVRELTIPINVLNFLILEMELAGRIERHFGNKVSLVRDPSS